MEAYQSWHRANLEGNQHGMTERRGRHAPGWWLALGAAWVARSLLCSWLSQFHCLACKVGAASGPTRRAVDPPAPSGCAWCPMQPSAPAGTCRRDGAQEGYDVPNHADMSLRIESLTLKECTICKFNTSCF